MPSLLLRFMLLFTIYVPAGNLGYLWIYKRYGIASKTMLLVSIGCNVIIPLYGLVGFASTTFGVRQGWEIVMVAIWYGIHIGAYQAFSRAIFATLVPRGKERYVEIFITSKFQVILILPCAFAFDVQQRLLFGI